MRINKQFMSEIDKQLMNEINGKQLKFERFLHLKSFDKLDSYCQCRLLVLHGTFDDVDEDDWF